MGEKTGISWTDHTWNLVWGCTKYSPGCANCYAESTSKVFGYDVWGADKPRKVMSEHHWNDPIRWNRKAEKLGVIKKVFCSSMADVFEDHETVTEERKKLWPLIKKTPNLIWQILTKRSERIESNLPDDWGNGYPNVWLGVSVENNDYCYRADHLRKIPAVVHFISYEPALGPINKIDLTHIEWLIAGGESGSKFRPHDPAWMYEIKDICKKSNVAFFYKQGSGLKSKDLDDTLDGIEYKEYPFVLNTLTN